MALVQRGDALCDREEQGSEARRVPVGDDYTVEVQHVRVDGQHGQVPLPGAQQDEQHGVACVDVEVDVVVQRA